MRVSDIISRSAVKIFNDMQKLDTREEMIDYLRSLPREDEEDI